MFDVKVSVVEFSDRRFFMMQYRDPVTGLKKTESTKIERDGSKKARTDAERVAAKLEEKLRSGRHGRATAITWGQFRERYETEVLASLAENTADKAASIFNTVESILPNVRDGRLSSLTSERLSYLQAELRAGNRAESTIAGYLAHLRAALGWAVDQGMIPALPKIKRPKRAKRARTTTPMKGRPITVEEFERMLDKVEAVVGAQFAALWKRYLRGLWTSGLRLAESLELYWDRPDKLCVDLSGRRPMLAIPAECEKAHQDRLLPITPEFAELLLATPPEKRKGRVFPLKAAKMRGAATSRFLVGNTISRIGKKAGVVVHRTTTAEGEERVKYASAHDLRRSFGERWSVLVMPQTLMVLMRHSCITTTQRYYVGRNAQTTADAVWEAYERKNGASNTSGNTRPEKDPKGGKPRKQAGDTTPSTPITSEQ